MHVNRCLFACGVALALARNALAQADPGASPPARAASAAAQADRVEGPKVEGGRITGAVAEDELTPDSAPPGDKAFKWSAGWKMWHGLDFSASQARGECDFVWDIAAPLPLLLIADMLGFPPESYDDLLHWSDDLIRGTTINDPDAAMKAAMAGMAFREFQLGVIADRRSKPPQDDLVSILCYAEIDGERLGDEDIIQESLLILIGGDETSRHVMTDGMLALMAHPDQMAILRDDPSKIEVGVEELLRWVTPIKNMSRTVTRDVELHGETLREGDQLILMYPAANRDPRVFDDPDTLDVQRNPNPHLAFGFGPHFCMGASLARMELRVMFGELLRRLPDLHLAGDPLPRRASNFISGPEAMPVAFTPTT